MLHRENENEKNYREPDSVLSKQKKMLHEQKKEMQNNSRDLKDIEENKYKNKSLIIFMSSTVKYDH
jgi:hypothetical protein